MSLYSCASQSFRELGLIQASRNADAHRALSCVALASRRLLGLAGRSAVRWQFSALDALLPSPERRTGQMSHPLHRRLQSSSRQRSGLRLLDRACQVHCLAAAIADSRNSSNPLESFTLVTFPSVPMIASRFTTAIEHLAIGFSGNFGVTVVASRAASLEGRDPLTAGRDWGALLTLVDSRGKNPQKERS